MEFYPEGGYKIPLRDKTTTDFLPKNPYLSPMEFHRAPLVRLVLPFMAGIITGYYFLPNYLVAVSLFGICMLVFLGFLIAKPRIQSRLSISPITGGLIYVSLFLAGQLAIYYSHHNHFNTHITKTQPCETLLVRLIENPEEKNKTYRVVANIEYGFNNKKTIETFGKVQLYFIKTGFDSTLKYGDYVLIKNVLEPPQKPPNPAEFDYAKWLEYQEIYQQAFLQPGDYTKTGKNNTNPVFAIAFAARQHFDALLNTSMPDSNTYGVASALVLGQRNHVADELTDAYSRTGTIHILAVSGLHVMAIYVLLSKLLGFLTKTLGLRVLRASILLMVIWLYAFITGLAPSIARAAVMISFVVLGDVMSRKTNLYNSLAASALFILCMDAKALFNIGFQLSYLAVIGIGWLYTPIYKLLTVKNWLLNKCWGLLCVTFAAQLATFPLCVYYFHQFPNYFLLSNLLLVPLSMCALYGGFLLFVVSPIPLLTTWAGKLEHIIIWLSNTIALQIQNLSLSYTSYLYFSFWGTILVYVAIITLIVFIIYHKKQSLFVSLATGIVLLVLAIYRDFYTYRQTQFTLYALPNKQTAISYIEQGKALVWSDSLINPNSKLFRRSIEPHLVEANTGPPVLYTGNGFGAKNIGLYGGHYIALYGKTILLFDDNTSLYGIRGTKWDVIIIDKSPKLKLAELKKQLHFDKLLITNNNSTSKIKKWQDEAQELGVPIHNVAEKGAYTLNF